MSKQMMLKVSSACLLLVTVSLYQNCAKESFSNTPLLAAASFGTPIDPGKIACNPFDPPPTGAAPGTKCNSRAFVGNLYVEPRANLVPGHQWGMALPVGALNVDAYIQAPWRAALTVVMSSLDVEPFHAFTDGFKTADGNILNVPNSTDPLIEWFALELQGQFQLNAGDGDGQYQLAIVSDDGSNVAYLPTGGGGYQPLIDDQSPGGVQAPGGPLPGGQSPRMGCSRTFGDTSTIVTLAMNSASVVPLRIRWYQGPRTGLAVMLMYRKVPTSLPLADSLCETITETPSALAAISANGWKIIGPANLAPNPLLR